MITALLAAALTLASPPDQVEQFVSYGRVPTWVGVAVDWDRPTVRLDLYAQSRFQGHAEYVSRGLGTGLRFREFKALVSEPARRRYLPFFLYDLRACPITAGGRALSWAIRLEDYQYRDTDDHLAAEVLRLATLAERLLGRPGLVVLARSPRVRPNRTIAPALERAGLVTLTLQELLDAVGARAVQVLNPGTAVGTLRLVDPDAPPHLLGPRDIAVFRELPPRLPPVAGIITLAPQTPLSHVNLLARNRGTPNLYATDLSHLPAAESLMGQLVRLVAKPNQVALTPISQERAERWWSRHPPRRLTIPTPNTHGPLLTDLTRASPTVREVGAKAANYARLRALLPDLVRPAFALGFRVYLGVMESSGAAAELAAILDASPPLTRAALAERLAALRRRIRTHGRVPRAVIGALRQAFRALPPDTGRVRLRSSTNCEDLPDFNGAGLYRSVGFDRADDDATLARKLLQVFASLWRTDAFQERAWFGIDHRRAAMAVLISPAFSGELADGVAITTTDLGTGQIQLVINAQPGERSVARPGAADTPEALRLSLAMPDARVDVDARSPYGAVFAGQPRRAALLRQLAAAVRILHTTLTHERPGYGVDVEWKLVAASNAGGGTEALFLKQVRLLATPLPE